MSIHVCPCMHHGAVEWHLRYPGMSQEAAQGIADKINSGMLDSPQGMRNRIAALESELAQAREAITELHHKTHNELVAARAECERLRAALRTCRSALWRVCLVCLVSGAYDWNADPDQLTLVSGKAFALADSLLVDSDEARLAAIDAALAKGE